MISANVIDINTRFNEQLSSAHSPFGTARHTSRPKQTRISLVAWPGARVPVGAQRPLRAAQEVVAAAGAGRRPDLPLAAALRRAARPQVRRRGRHHRRHDAHPAGGVAVHHHERAGPPRALHGGHGAAGLRDLRLEHGAVRGQRLRGVAAGGHHPRGHRRPGRARGHGHHDGLPQRLHPAARAAAQPEPAGRLLLGPVMGGFISAGGLLIMLSQFSNALGIKFASQDYPPQTVYQIFKHIGHTNLTAFAVAAISIVYLFAVKIIKKRYFPSPVLMQLFESPKKEEDDKASEQTERLLTPVQNNAHTIHSHGFSLSEEQYVSMENAYARHSAAGRVSDVGDKRLQETTKPKSKPVLVAIFLARTMCDLGPLVVCIFGGIVGYLLGSSHLKLTGAIPGGFPDPKVPWYGFTSHLIDGDKFGSILYHSLTVVVVVFLSSIAMAKRLAIQRGEDINTDQELTGLGIASIVAGFFQAMPPTGGMSRTAVNLLNAHTQLASIITCLIVILSLYTLTSALYYLPSATLVSIIIVAGYSLVEFKEAKWLYRVKRDEFWVWTLSFILTLGLGVLDGLIASIICSVLALMWKTKVSPVSFLGELDNGSFVDRELFPEARDLHDIIIVRVDSSLYFANCERVALAIEHEMVRLKSLGITTRGVLVDARNMNDMDATTIQVMSDTQEKLEVRKVRFGIANAKSRVHDLLAATNIIKRIVAGNPSIPLDEAVLLLREHPTTTDKTRLSEAV